MADASQQLQEAFQEIEDGNLQEARELLEAIRPQNENNPDFWWVYAHALEDENDGRNALARVRQLAPNYPNLQNVEQEAGIRVSQVQPLQRIGTPAPKANDDIDFDDLDEDFDDTTDADDMGGGAPRWVIPVAVLVVIVIIFGFLYMSGIFGGGGSTPEATQIVIQDTDEPVITFEATETIDLATAEAVVPTDIPVVVTEESTEDITAEASTDEPDTVTPAPIEAPVDPFAELYGDLAAYGVPDGGVSVLGTIMVIETCSNPGPAANNNIVGIMDVFVTAEFEIPQDVAALNFNITNCNTNAISLILGIDRDPALAYIAGTSSQTEFLQAMRRVA